MIVDRIDNSHLYSGLSAVIAKALKILKDDNPAAKPDGRYEIDGDNLFYIVQRYKAKPLSQGRLEAHQKYIDVQFIAQGQELMGFSPLDNLEVQEPYNESKDIAFYNSPAKISTIILKSGMFCILFPEDAHMPGLQLGESSNVLKIVIKLKANTE